MDTSTQEINAGTGNELVIFDRKFTPAALFVPGTMDPLIDHIRERVKSEATDPTTETGRKRIISLAMKVTRTKTAIDAARKQLVSDEKRRLAAIDAEGRRVWGALEELAAEVRQPVTEYEEREKTRVEAHRAAIDAIGRLGDFDTPPTTADLETRLAEAEAVGIDHEEFTAAAKTAKATVAGILAERLAASRKADAERAELERLRREATEREQREREERAAAKARAEAEEAARFREEEARQEAEAERQRIEREAAEREAKIRADAEAKERAAAEQLARAEREKTEAKAAAEKAERDRHAAAQKAEEDRQAAEIAAKKREQAAADGVRQRIEAERAAEAEATRKREANKAHQAKINNEALADIVLAAGIDDATARRVIAAIAKGNIRHVKISY